MNKPCHTYTQRDEKPFNRNEKQMFDITSMFAGAKLPSNLITWIGKGNHLFALAELKQIQKDGEAPKYMASFLVVESNLHEVGIVVSTMFKPYSEVFKGAGAKEAGRMVDLVMKLFNYSNPGPAGPAFTKLLTPEQPGRGYLINAVGVESFPKPNADGSPKLDANGQPKGPWVNVSYRHAQGQTAEEVAARRKIIDGLPQYSKSAPPVTPIQTPPKSLF